MDLGERQVWPPRRRQAPCARQQALAPMPWSESRTSSRLFGAYRPRGSSRVAWKRSMAWPRERTPAFPPVAANSLCFFTLYPSSESCLWASKDLRHFPAYCERSSGYGHDRNGKVSRVFEGHGRIVGVKVEHFLDEVGRGDQCRARAADDRGAERGPASSTAISSIPGLLVTQAASHATPSALAEHPGHAELSDSITLRWPALLPLWYRSCVRLAPEGSEQAFRTFGPSLSWTGRRAA